VENLAGCNVLVVEDEALVALDLAQALDGAGAHVSIVHSIAQAAAVVEKIKITAAVVDIKVGGEDVSSLCRDLSQRDIRFVFYSGYGVAPEGWDHVPIVNKPASREEIVDAVGRLCGSHEHAA
jgi:DNA-binding NtrC family response regulator